MDEGERKMGVVPAASMVEAVAKAIYEDRNGKGCRPWSRHTNEHKRPYRSDARAAIQAMREPTEAMIQAAHHRLAGDDRIENVYTAMIDRALQDD